MRQPAWKEGLGTLSGVARNDCYGSEPQHCVKNRGLDYALEYLRTCAALSESGKNHGLDCVFEYLRTCAALSEKNCDLDYSSNVAWSST